MIVYAESSAVLAWMLGEPAGSDVLTELRRAEGVFCSRLTLLECSRGLLSGVQMKKLVAADSGKAANLLHAAALCWSVLEITEAVCRRAAQPFPEEPVRSLDAIHLASLLELQAHESRIQPLALDHRVRANAVALGFTPLP